MTRGQADGFGLEILSKLKDVKSKNSQVTLLHFIVTTYMRKTSSLITEKLELPVPDPYDIGRASSVNFDDVQKDLSELQTKINGILIFN